MLSLGFRADLLFNRLHTRLEEKPHYWRASTPSMPDFYFGNFLILKQPLTPSLLPGALEQFESEFELGHRAFGWTLQDEQVDLEGFMQAGFQGCVVQILQCDGIAAPEALPLPVSAQPEFRALASDTDWAQCLELQFVFHADETDVEATRRFITGQQDYVRQLVNAGLARWFGLFQGEKLLAVAGLVYDEQLAQIRDVITHPEHRRQGLCRYLLGQMAQWAAEQQGVSHFVITADEDYHALPLYRSLGFMPVAREAQIWCAAT